MKNVVLAILLASLVLPATAQESQTVYNFLRLPVSAHVAALGGDNITVIEDDASLLFHNPALVSSVSDKTLSLNGMTYMQGTINASASFVRAAGDKATWAVGAQLMSYGTLKEMTSDGQQTGTFSPKDISVNGTFAYLLGKGFVGGITAKTVFSYIGNYNSLGMAVDLGVNYYNEDYDLSVSAVARNLGGQLSAYEDDFERMPLDLQIGVTKRLLNSPLRFTATLVRLNDWQYGFGKHLIIGADVILSPQFYIAAGYNGMRASEMKISEDEGSSAHGAGLSIGAGMLLERFKVNLAYARYHVASSSLLLNLSYTL
jgi:long-subunit fatty acid transport protein